MGLSGGRRSCLKDMGPSYVKALYDLAEQWMMGIGCSGKEQVIGKIDNRQDYLREEATKRQKENQDKTVSLIFEIGSCQFGWQDAGQNAAAVKGRDR